MDRVQATPQLRTEVSSVLFELVGATAAISLFIGTNAPAEKSTGAELGAFREWGTASAAEMSLRGSSFSLIAGCDHLEAFAVVLRSPRSPTMSLATLARGAVESWARAWWVLAAEDEHDLIYRAAALSLAEAQWAVRRPDDAILEQAADGSFKEIPAQEVQSKLAETVRLHGGNNAPKAPGYTVLAAEFLESVGLLKSMYSHLSGVAHGERMAQSAFTFEVPFEGFDPEGPIGAYEFGLPRDHLFEYTRTLVYGQKAINHLVLDVWSAPTPVRERWNAALGRILQRMDRLDDRAHVTAPVSH